MGKWTRYIFIFGVTVILFAIATIASHAQTTEAAFVKDTYFPATALLYSQDQNGGMKMRCTATAIENNDKGYVFVTAAHCGCGDDPDEKTATAEKTFFYITNDSEGEKKFYTAKPIACGYQHAGDDFFLLQVDTTDKFPTIPLGHDPNTLDRVINVASPLGLGKQVFVGSISSGKVDRPVVQDDINWTNVILLQLFGTDGGSSGSSIVCADQRAICGFIVGKYQSSSFAMPVSRLIKMREELAAGKYKHWKADPDEGKK